jgi:hypothetical protein
LGSIAESDIAILSHLKGKLEKHLSEQHRIVAVVEDDLLRSKCYEIHNI